MGSEDEGGGKRGWEGVLRQYDHIQGNINGQ